MKKTFKIGECCYGGIAQVEKISNETFSVRLLDWDTKEIISSVLVHNSQLLPYMEEMSTYYWADKIYNYFNK